MAKPPQKISFFLVYIPSNALVRKLITPEVYVGMLMAIEPIDTQAISHPGFWQTRPIRTTYNLMHCSIMVFEYVPYRSTQRLLSPPSCTVTPDLRPIQIDPACMASEIPGPRPWPLVGNLPNIDLANSIQSIADIGKAYGDFISGRKCVRCDY